MSEIRTVQTLPLWKKIIYALGQFGWSLVSYAPGMLLIYFYLPPETRKPGFPPRIYQGAILGVFTIIGLAYALGRVFDAVTDPVIAGLSDRSKSKFGRRRIYLAVSVLPFSLLSLLIFTPPMKGSSPINTVWVFVMVLVFYWFMTMYVTPYFAWLSELGHTPKERLQLSTLISVTWALGAAVGSQTFLFKSIFENMGYDPTAAFQITMVIFAVAGFVLMLLPVIFINEKKYCESHQSSEKIFEALKSAFGNRDFRLFTISDLSYWVAMAIISSGLVYYVTILLREGEAFTSSLQIYMFGLSFIFYVPVTFIASKFGKKPVLIVGFFFFIASYLVVMGLGKLPLETTVDNFKQVYPARIVDGRYALYAEKSNYDESPVSINSVLQYNGEPVLLKKGVDYDVVKDAFVILKKKAFYISDTESEVNIAVSFRVGDEEGLRKKQIINWSDLNNGKFVFDLSEKEVKDFYVENVVLYKSDVNFLKSGKYFSISTCDYKNKKGTRILFKKDSGFNPEMNSDLDYNHKQGENAALKEGVVETVYAYMNNKKWQFIPEKQNFDRKKLKVNEILSGEKSVEKYEQQVFQVGYGDIKDKENRILLSGDAAYNPESELVINYNYKSREVQGYLLILVTAIALAIFGILPNAIIADIAEADGIKTGNFKAGVFFGARTFMSKLGMTVGGLLLPSLLLLGKSIENDIGVRLTGLAAILFVGAGLIIFLAYNEKGVLKILATKEKLSKDELKEMEK